MLISSKIWESIEPKKLMQYDKEYLLENFCYGGTYEPNVIFFCDHDNKIVKEEIKHTGKNGKLYYMFRKELKEELKKQGL